MKNYSIEQLNKARNRALIWFIIGWGCWFLSFNLNRVMEKGIVWLILLGIGLIGWGVTLVYLRKTLQLYRFLKKNPRLADSLNDELVIANRQKSWKAGIITILISTCCIIYPFSIFWDISGRIVCECVIFIGVVAPIVSFVILNRDTDGTLDT